MRIGPTVAAAAFFGFVSGTVAPAAAQGDIKLGEALLTRDCARCHAVGRGGESPNK